MVSKAVVMARGLGTRMKAASGEVELTAEQANAAASGAKAMMPLGGRPFLDHVLTNLAALDGDMKIRLSSFRDNFVWLYKWRCG